MSKNGRAVLLAVSGGVAAYKSAVLCSRLVQSGYAVHAVMSSSATHFLGPATLAALTGKPVAQDVFEPNSFPLGAHIQLAQDRDLMVIAPATANIMAKLASGIADDLITTLYLQVACPVLLAPAMSNIMWEKPSVQRNVERLIKDGCHFVGPEQGWLSCRQKGSGRMSEPETILQAIENLLAD